MRGACGGAELMVDGEMVEDGEQQIEFLSGGETAQGEFVFDKESGKRRANAEVLNRKRPSSIEMTRRLQA